MEYTRYKVSKHYHLDELVDLKTYVKYAKNNKLYKLAYKVGEMVMMAENTRQGMDEPGVINNYWKTFVNNDFNVEDTYRIIENTKWLRQWSGYRPKGSPYYTEDSLHSVFKAIDMIFSSAGWLDKFYHLVRQNYEDWEITAMEINNSWGHIDKRFIYNQTKLFEFSA